MKIPKEAKKMFTGVLFDVYQWKQKMFDGSTTTFEGLHRKNDGVTIIATQKDKIFYAEEIQSSIDASFITLPGGKREENETPLETAKRELLEETGLVSDDWELFNMEDNFSTKVQWTVHTFIARNARTVSKQSLDPGEKIKIKKTTFDKFLDIASKPNFRNKDISLLLMRWRLYQPKKLAQFKKKLFG